MIEIVRIAAAIGKHQSGRVSPARPSGALGIVEGLGGDVPQKDGV